MEQVEKRIRLLGYIKWAGLALGLLMYGVTLRAFGEAWATGLGVLAACAFFFVCEDGAAADLPQCGGRAVNSRRQRFFLRPRPPPPPQSKTPLSPCA